MDLATKNAWAQNLRSGKFKKITVSLHDGGDGYCALGVLCHSLGIPTIAGSCPSAYVALDDLGVEIGYFWYLNDAEDHSFAEIADIIDMLSVDDRVFNFGLIPNSSFVSMADR